MSDNNVVTEMHLATVERWMEQMHKAHIETNKNISSLSSSVQVLVTQEQVRAERDAVTAEQIAEIKEVQNKYGDSWRWSKSLHDIWKSYVSRILGPIIITGIIAAIVASAGFSIYTQGG